MSSISSELALDSPNDAVLSCRDGTRPRVLFAEDAMASRVLTAVILKRLGCNVDAVEHGEEALMFMQNFDYDIVLMDVEMPVMDGVTAAREIRSLGGVAGKTPIIALSAFIADCGVVPEWQGEFDAGLTKPAGKEILKNVIQRALDGDLTRIDRREETSDASPERLDDCARALPLFDAEAFEQAKSQVSEVIWSELLVTAADDLARFSHALARAEVARDMAEVASNLHKLLGVSRTFAAKKLQMRVNATRLTLKKALEPGSGRAEPVNITYSIKQLLVCAEETVNALYARSRECVS